jgi:hydroxypyruvate isomerase
MTHELSVCTEMLFREFGEPMSLAQLRAVKGAGIDAVEFWFWRNKDIDAVERALGETGLSTITMVSEPQSQAVDPSRQDEFVTAVRESLPIAQRLGIPNLVLVAGDTQEVATDGEQRKALTDALRAAAPYAEEAGITLVLENLNSRIDHVGTYLSSTPLALEILRDVESANVKMLYDLYHSVVMDEDPAEVLAGAIDLIGHVQVADHPGRHEPGSGLVDWKKQIRTLRRLGYQGAVGLEYTPSTGNSTESLRHIRDAVADVSTA